MNHLLLDERYLVARVLLLLLDRLFLLGGVLRFLLVLLWGLTRHPSLLLTADVFSPATIGKEAPYHNGARSLLTSKQQRKAEAPYGSAASAISLVALPLFHMPMPPIPAPPNTPA
jgi:hypothetical protein